MAAMDDQGDGGEAYEEDNTNGSDNAAHNPFTLFYADGARSAD
jgi:hypothetical protein